MQGSVWELYCSLSICLNLFWFRGSACLAYGETVINQRRFKSQLLGIIQKKIQCEFKMNNFVGDILQNKFYAYCYILLSGTRRCTPICGAAMLIRCNWCRSLAAVNCILHWIVLILSTLNIRNSSCITLVWLHHNHKMTVSYHKNGLVSSHQTVPRWFICVCSVVRILYSDETSWLSTAYLPLCQDGIRGWNHFALMSIVFTF